MELDAAHTTNCSSTPTLFWKTDVFYFGNLNDFFFFLEFVFFHIFFALAIGKAEPWKKGLQGHWLYNNNNKIGKTKFWNTCFFRFEMDQAKAASLIRQHIHTNTNSHA